MQAKLQQMVKSAQAGSTSMIKSTLVVVLRDMPLPIERELPPYANKYMDSLHKTWEQAHKPRELNSPQFDDCFKVCDNLCLA